MRKSVLCLIIVAFVAVTQGVSRGDDGLPAPTNGRVDFTTQIKPILQGRCLSCHARGKYKGGLSLETREALLKGGEEGPAVLVGKSAESNLVRLVAGLEEGRRMPQKGPALGRDDIALLRAWIDQGLSWPDGLSFGFRQAPISPRNPDVPSRAETDSAIDRFVARSLERQGVAIEWTPASDRVFARRVSLDFIGLLPTPERLSAFEQDARPDKREKLVEELLNDRQNYAEHWLSFWNDALRNAYRGTGFIDGGRKTITGWLFRSLFENTRYDRFVRELVSPVPGAEGFTKGIVWRGVVNASQVPPVQAAQNVSQVFLGTNLKCASCHDSFVNHWKLSDAYSLASVFSDKPLEIHRCDKPTGQDSTVGFVYPSLGTIDGKAPRDERMKRLAEILTTPENGRFSRTIVNRLWAQLMGRGIVEPLDDMDQAPWDQDLLDWLATDFVAHGHDLKHTLALICNSRAYQLPSVGLAEPSSRSSYVFRGPLTKRMSAEQFADALSAVTGVWPKPSDEMTKVDGRGQGGQLAAVGAVIGKGEPLTLRAALAFDDPLLAALGRTSREQVVTRRESVATTLQALELINGLTLDRKLREGAKRWIDTDGNAPETLISKLFLAALGRQPTTVEREATVELLGSPVSVEGVQDFLWSLAMLPEFQLIR